MTLSIYFFWLSVKQRCARMLESLKNDIVWSVLPRWLVYMAAIRLIAHASHRMPRTQMEDIGALEALSLWEQTDGKF